MTQPDEKNTDLIADKLIAYLRDEFKDFTLEYDLPLTQLKGGMETATYQFQLKGAQEDLTVVLRI